MKRTKTAGSNPVHLAANGWLMSQGFNGGTRERYVPDTEKYPECETCREINGGFGPRHEASINCRSGKHAHCTCDTCF
jgi:hypothetical protein